MKPNELFYSKIIPLLKKEGMSEQTPRKDWPHIVQLRVLKELMNETPCDLLAKYVCTPSNVCVWVPLCVCVYYGTKVVFTTVKVVLDNIYSSLEKMCLYGAVSGSILLLSAFQFPQQCLSLTGVDFPYSQLSVFFPLVSLGSCGVRPPVPLSGGAQLRHTPAPPLSCA